MTTALSAEAMPLARRVFISYSRKDGGYVAHSLRGLLDGSGCRVWLDTEGIPGGASWSKELESPPPKGTVAFTAFYSDSRGSSAGKLRWNALWARLMKLMPEEKVALLDWALGFLLIEDSYRPRVRPKLTDRIRIWFDSCRDTLRAALNVAIKWGLVVRNVAELATLPARPKQTSQVYDKDQARLFPTPSEGTDSKVCSRWLSVLECFRERCSA